MRVDPPSLWLVATPIGNLADLAPRAVEVLARCALICCEDTRRTGRLLQHAGIKGPKLAVTNEHTESARIGDVLEVLASGGDVAVVSDAGTPGISDPGERLVRAAIDAGHQVIAVPGPVAAITALVVSGLATDRFAFEGFLPRSGGERRQRLADLIGEPRTAILYEAPHRIQRTLEDLRSACGDQRQVVVCRELTKLHEQIIRGTLGTIDIGEPRGEYVIVLGGASRSRPVADDDQIRDALRAALAAGHTTRDAVALVTAQLGTQRKTVYALAVTL